MIYIEDALLAVANHYNLLWIDRNDDPWDLKFITSVGQSLFEGKTLTEKQARSSITALQNLLHLLDAPLKEKVRLALENPTFKYPFRIIDNSSSIELAPAPDDTCPTDKVISIRFKFSETAITKLQELRSKYMLGNPRGRYISNNGSNAWVFWLSERSIMLAKEFAQTGEFSVSPELETLMEVCSIIQDNPHDWAPTVDLKNGVPLYKNADEFMPKLSSTELIPALLEARRHGVFNWTDEVGRQLNTHQNSTTVNFLKAAPGTQMVSKNPVSSLNELIVNSWPVMVVLPPLEELSRTRSMYNNLRTLGIENHEMSVLFRLDGANNEFNTFVRENELNSPVTDATKVVFIREEVPKPLIASDRKFNLIILMGFTSALMPIKKYMDNHHGVIYQTTLEE